MEFINKEKMAELKKKISLLAKEYAGKDKKTSEILNQIEADLEDGIQKGRYLPEIKYIIFMIILEENMLPLETANIFLEIMKCE